MPVCHAPLFRFPIAFSYDGKDRTEDTHSYQTSESQAVPHAIRLPAHERRQSRRHQDQRHAKEPPTQTEDQRSRFPLRRKNARKRPPKSYRNAQERPWQPSPGICIKPRFCHWSFSRKNLDARRRCQRVASINRRTPARETFQKKMSISREIRALPDASAGAHAIWR